MIRDWKYDWSYLARTGRMLIGSSTKQGSAFTSFWGGSGEGWYDAKSGEATAKVCSDNLFALSDDSQNPAWTYHSQGVIINSTISIDNGRVYFVESRNPTTKASTSRRLATNDLWQDLHLVAIDQQTGERTWQRPLEAAPGTVAFYLAASEDELALVSSSADRKYHVYVSRQKDGKQAWTQTFNWKSDNHGGHMSRPAIVGGKLYVRPRAFNLETGAPLAQQMPGGGCGTYACTQDAIFFRAGNVTVWNQEKGKASSWNRLRPDCWLSTIPAGGMLLSPEGGGGCSCGKWMETSIGFIPRRK